MIVAVDVSTEDGNALFVDAINNIDIPESMAGSVPTLVIGDTALIGSQDIPNFLPGIIEEGLANGGIDWPRIPLLLEALEAQGMMDGIPDDEINSQGETPTTESGQNNQINGGDEAPITDNLQQAAEPEDLTMAELFQRDLAGNSISVVVLLALIFSLIEVGRRYFKAGTTAKAWPVWIIPVLLLVGLVVAGYMTYVEINQVDAVCGPLGIVTRYNRVSMPGCLV